MTALEGVAGAGKTTSLVAIREAAEREEYIVKGLAPTSRAAQKLAEGGIRSTTLQRHLAPSVEGQDQRKHFLHPGRIEPCEHQANERTPPPA